MRILLVCSGGYSTSILMKKIQNWCKVKDLDIQISAVGKEIVDEVWKDYDCILLGPQIAYASESIEEIVNIPVASISPSDYGLGNVQNVINLAFQILGKQEV